MVTTILTLVYFFNLTKVKEEVIQRNYIKDVFANRITDQWNSLLDACVNCTTLNQFKSHISKIWNRKSELSRVILESRLIWLYSLCLLLQPLSFDSGGFGKFGKISKWKSILW